MKKLLYKLFIAVSILLFIPLFAGAESKEDADLDFLPSENNNEDNTNIKVKSTVETIENNRFNVILDNTLRVTDWKNKNEKLFKLPAQNNAGWSNLTRLGLRGDSPVGKKVSFKTDMLLNAYTREGESFTTSDDLRLDIKEAYISWHQSPTQFLDVGRINIKNGVATGFNPTDYFKVGTVLDRNTEDVSQLRDARLGALLIKAQKLWDGGSLTVLASPEISDSKDRWYSDEEITGMNLHKSNDRSRALAKLTLSNDFSPEMIYYNEAGKHNLGVNISRVFSKQWFAYAEWNIGQRRNLLDKAFLDLRDTNQLSPTISQQFPRDYGEYYQQQLALGASYTSTSNITSKLEYHYNEAGLSKTDKNKWIDLGRTAQNDPATTGQLLSVRGTAQTYGEPLGKHSLFLHSTWTDAAINNLDLTALVKTNLDDNSWLTQLELAYTPNTNTELSLRYAKYNGDKESIYGSLDQEQTVSFQLGYSF